VPQVLAKEESDTELTRLVASPPTASNVFLVQEKARPLAEGDSATTKGA
jgi:hypothetical protein